MANNNNSWKRVGGFSRTGTQNYVRTNDAAMGGTTFGSTDVSYNTGNSTLRIGNNAGVVFINGDIDMSGGPGVGAPINRVRNVRDPIENQDVATKFYVDKTITSINQLAQGPPGPQGPPGIGFRGQNGTDGPTGATGCTGAIGPPGDVVGVKGPTGANGGTGATGAAGAVGATGPIGPIGAQGIQGIQGTQGIQGSNGTILWLNPDGDSLVNQLITDSYMLSTVPVISTVRKVGPISVSATYGNALKMIPSNRFWNTALKASTLAVIPSGVWVLNLYANVPSNSDANQVALYAAVFMITGTTNQPSPDSLIIETKDGGDAGYYPPRPAYLPDHVKYIGRSWTDDATTLTSKTGGAVINSTTRKLYKIEMPVEFTTLKDASGNTENVYLQLQIYIKNTTVANQTANVNLYYQTDLNTNETTYSYLQTTFGAVGIRGLEGATGSDGKEGATGATGTAGTAGPTGIAGPTGTTGTRGPQGDRGETGPTGPAGQSNSVGRQYTVQYRSNEPQGGPTDDSDVSGSFAGNANFRFIPNPPGYTANASDATTGTVVLNDLACRSVHSSFYIEDPSITGTSTRPRTFVKGGENVSGPGGGFIVLASGKNTAGDGGDTNSPGTVADITHGFKLVHNIVGNPPTVAFNLHNDNKTTAKIGMKFDLTTGNIIAAEDKFCVVNQTGAVGVGGMTPGEMTAVGQSGLNRALHVCGNVMVGTNPAAGATDAASAMILLNKATTTPSTAPLSLYPGVYHRTIAAGSEVTALGGATNSITTDASGGLGIMSPNFITFQTGSALANNSIVINQAGVVSVTGRANLNGPVSVGKNFAAVTQHPSVAPNTTPIMDVSGIIHISNVAGGYATDIPRIKLISNVISPVSDIPTATADSTANEIRGVNTTEPVRSGFLRLTAQSPANSCIDLIGYIEDTNAAKFSNSVRISTGAQDRMVINGSGNVGIGTTTPGVRLDVSGAASVAAARIMSTATTGTALITTGRVGINISAPTATLDVSGDARVTAASATSTALTTTGRVGINISAPTVPLDVAGAAKIAGTLDMNSNKIVNLANPTSDQDAATRNYVNTYVNTSIPIGGIIMWSGTGVTLPSNWKLCDGTTYGSVVTPDLRSRVVMGVSSVGVSRLENKYVGTGDIIKLGRDISGDGTLEQSGYSVSLSADGRTVAIGAPYNSSSRGITRVYRYDGSTWNQIGSAIDGADGTVEESGYSVSLSADGTSVAVGAWANSGQKGVTRIYKYNATLNTWPQFGPTISGVNASDTSGWSVSLSADGMTVAVGEFNANGSYGITRIYKYDDIQKLWTQSGSNILGDGTPEQSGYSVSLSADGTTVAVGAWANSGQKGVTRIYKYNATLKTWPQFGATILGDGTSERYGWSVSLSADGMTVAVGAPGNSSFKGVTRVYKYNASTITWPQFGPTISGVGVFEQTGYSVSLSADGTTVAIGAWANSNNKGITRIYKYNVSPNTWTQSGPTISGVDAGETSGWSVSLSADGTTVAIGARSNSGGKGVTRVYSLDPVVNPNIYGLAFIMRVS